MSRSSRGGPPAWLIFLVAVAVVFGGYYLWLGVANYLRTGGMGIVEATERANIIETATAERIVSNPSRTPPPTMTPVPECQDFEVSVPNAIVRRAPSTNAPVFGQLSQGARVCVLGRAEENGEWYVIDNAPQIRRLDLVYMHQSIIQAVNPTATPSRTPTAPPTVTEVPSATATLTPTPAPTATPDPNATDTPVPSPTFTPSPTLSPTPPFQSA